MSTSNRNVPAYEGRCTTGNGWQYFKSWVNNMGGRLIDTKPETDRSFSLSIEHSMTFLYHGSLKSSYYSAAIMETFSWVMTQNHPNIKNREGYSIQGYKIYYSSVSTEWLWTRKQVCVMTIICSGYSIINIVLCKERPLWWLCFAQYNFSNKINTCCNILYFNELKAKECAKQIVRLK